MFASVVLFVVLTRCAIDEINGVVQLRFARSAIAIFVSVRTICVLHFRVLFLLVVGVGQCVHQRVDLSTFTFGRSAHASIPLYKNSLSRNIQLA